MKSAVRSLPGALIKDCMIKLNNQSSLLSIPTGFSSLGNLFPMAQAGRGGGPKDVLLAFGLLYPVSALNI